MAERLSNFKIWKACERKKRYDTKDAADVFAALYQQQTYRCRYCGGYHLTNGVAKTLAVVRRVR